MDVPSSGNLIQLPTWLAARMDGAKDVSDDCCSEASDGEDDAFEETYEEDEVLVLDLEDADLPRAQALLEAAARAVPATSKLKSLDLQGKHVLAGAALANLLQDARFGGLKQLRISSACAPSRSELEALLRGIGRSQLASISIHFVDHVLPPGALNENPQDENATTRGLEHVPSDLSRQDILAFDGCEEFLRLDAIACVLPNRSLREADVFYSTMFADGGGLDAIEWTPLIEFNRARRDPTKAGQRFIKSPSLALCRLLHACSSDPAASATVVQEASTLHALHSQEAPAPKCASNANAGQASLALDG